MIGKKLIDGALRVLDVAAPISRYELSPEFGWYVRLSRYGRSKYFFAGGGAYDGTIPGRDQALPECYAAAGSDTGHVAPKDPNDGSWALNNLDAQMNYAYLATDVVTLLGKEILRAFYGRHERYSYFVGCSNGGKMALAEIQGYPNDFDAAVVGDPSINRFNFMMQFTWNAQVLAGAPIPPSKIPVIEQATMNVCPKSGGAIDGLILTPGQLHAERNLISISKCDERVNL